MHFGQMRGLAEQRRERQLVDGWSPSAQVVKAIALASASRLAYPRRFVRTFWEQRSKHELCYVILSKE